MKLNSQALPSFEGFKANVEAHEETLRVIVGRSAARNIGQRLILGGHDMSSKDQGTPTPAPLGEIINRLHCALPWGGSGAARANGPHQSAAATSCDHGQAAGADHPCRSTMDQASSSRQWISILMAK
ncbi:MAG: hypothetical protein VX181_12335, partial [Pseudomonadota bacterium]|nr:hypothetical protein [Pseudomonadota bacterium]